MRRFFSVWLVWIVVVVFAIAILASYIPLTRQAEMTARDDLTMLNNAAFIQLDKAQGNVDAAMEAAGANLVSKGRAIARFLAHDDSLLQTDALKALCDMLEITSIDVTDGEGVVTASSVIEDVGLSLATDARTPCVAEALADDTELVKQDASNSALLMGCVPRSDTEGVVLLQTQDASVKEAKAQAEPGTVLAGMSFVNDLINVATEEGIDGAYMLDGYYCVRSTQKNISVVAARTLGSVYLIRNAVLLALSVFALLSIVAALIIQLLLAGSGRRHYVVKRPVREEALPDWMTNDAVPLPDSEPQVEQPEIDPGQTKLEEQEVSRNLQEAPPSPGKKKRGGREKRNQKSVEPKMAPEDPSHGEGEIEKEPGALNTEDRFVFSSPSQEETAPGEQTGESLPRPGEAKLPDRDKAGRKNKGEQEDEEGAFDRIY
jgi:hypothetical protein